MMTSAMVTLGIAVGGTSLIWYALMTRLQNRRANRRSSGDSSGAGNGNHGGGDAWSISNWFGGDNLVDSSGNPSDSGGAIVAEAAMAVEVATAVAEVINAAGLLKEQPH